MSSWARRAHVLGEAAPCSRGARFLARQHGHQLGDWRLLREVPDWLVCTPSERKRLAAAAVALLHRPALDRELRREVLEPVAALLGEPLFDAVCAAPVPPAAVAEPLPGLPALAAAGEQLLHEALPIRLGGGGNAAASAVAGAAADLLNQDCAA